MTLSIPVSVVYNLQTLLKWNSFQGHKVFSELAFWLIYQTENKLPTIFVFCMGTIVTLFLFVTDFFIGSLAVILLMNSSLFWNSVKERGDSVLLFWAFFVRWNLLGLIWVSNLLFGWIWRWFILPIACFSPTSSSENLFTASHWAQTIGQTIVHLCFPIEVILLFKSSVNLFIFSWNTSNSVFLNFEIPCTCSFLAVFV